MPVSRVLFSSTSCEWHTPKALLDSIMSEFGPLWDPADGGLGGLIHPWKKRVFCNPPYGRQTGHWIAKGAAMMDAGETDLIVWLLAARTDTRWFHDLILPRASDIRFIRGRLHFNEGGRATFPSMIVVWKSTQGDRDGPVG